MKNSFMKLSFGLLVTIGLTTMTACKKGENDPFISLKTRKGRITGEWKLVEGTVIETETIDGETGVYQTTYTSSTRVDDDGSTDDYTENLIINRDGTYEEIIVQNGSTVKVKGNWYFSGKNEDIDLKKKEAVVFSETEHVFLNGTTTYEGLHADRIILIDQLKNKKITFKGEIASDLTGPNPESYTYSYDRTFEKQ